MWLSDEGPASRIEIAHPNLRRISRFRSPDQPFAVRRKSRPLFVIRRRIQSPRFAAARRHDPQMRNPCVRFKIDIYAVEHDPLAARGRHRCADALKFYHVLEPEGALLRWRLREHQGGERENDCEQNFHEPQSFRLTHSGARNVLGSARLWRGGDRILRSRTFADLRRALGVLSQTKVHRQDAATGTLKASAPQNSASALCLTKYYLGASRAFRWTDWLCAQRALG